MEGKNTCTKSNKKILQNYDLSIELERGTYEACMTVYELKKQIPRMVAEEFAWLNDTVNMEVEKGSSVFEIGVREFADAKELWYLSNGDYVKAERNTEGYRLPTYAFELQAERTWPFIEGTAMVVFAEVGHEPELSRVREMKIHLAKPCVDMTDVLELLEGTE